MGLEGEAIGHCLVAEDGLLQLDNGEIDEKCEVRLYTFDAASNEEVMCVYYLRQGWAPYKPEGEAEPCPNYGVMHYLKGSAGIANIVASIYCVFLPSRSSSED